MLRTVRNSVINFIGSNTQANAVFRRITQRQVSRATATDAGGHSQPKTVDHGDFEVKVLPALGDNFMFLIRPKSHKGIIGTVSYMSFRRDLRNKISRGFNVELNGLFD